MVSLMEGHRVKFAMSTLLRSLRPGVEGLVFDIDVHSPRILRERDDLQWGIDAHGKDDVKCSLDAQVGHPVANFDPD